MKRPYKSVHQDVSQNVQMRAWNPSVHLSLLLERVEICGAMILLLVWKWPLLVQI